MPVSTPLLPRLATVLTGLGLSLTAHAQLAAPAWTDARALGAGSFSTGGTAVDAAGNTYEAGSFQTATFVIGGTTLTTQGGTDGYLAKYSPAGALLWVRQLGSAGPDSALDVALDADGSAYVSGIAGGVLTLGNNVALNGTTSRTFVVRYSPQGTPEWAQQTAGFSSGSSLGTDAAGHLYLTGSFSRTITFGTTTLTTPDNVAGVYLARFAAATGTLQALTLPFYYAPSTGGATYNLPRLTVAPTGEVYLLTGFSHPAIVGGSTLTSRGATDVLVARYSAQGTFEWVQQYGGAGIDFVNDGVADAAGRLYVSGYFTGPATFGTTTVAGAGDFDGCLLCYSAQGAMQWVQTLGGPGSDGFGGLALDAAGNPYAAANYSPGARLGPTLLPGAGSRDALVAAYTPQGQLRWNTTAGGPGFDSATSLGLDARGDIYVMGRFAETGSFGPLTLSVGSGLASETFLARLGNSVLATPAARPLALGFYPNPATDVLHLPALAAGTPVQLLDARGRLARTATVSAAATVSVGGLAPGLYALRATDGQGRVVAGKVVVE